MRARSCMAMIVTCPSESGRRRGRIESPAEVLGDELGLLGHLPIGVADHPESAGAEAQLLAAVTIDLSTRAVVAAAVDLDGEAVLTPQDVNLPAVEARVDLGHGQPGRLTEREERNLEPAAGEGEAWLVALE